MWMMHWLGLYSIKNMSAFAIAIASSLCVCVRECVSRVYSYYAFAMLAAYIFKFKVIVQRPQSTTTRKMCTQLQCAHLYGSFDT